MRGHAHVVAFGHGRDTLCFRNASRMGDVGLYDVDTARLKVRPDVLAREEPFAELSREVRKAVYILTFPSERCMTRTAIGMVVCA
jgi:hypothetical protein